MPPTKVVASSLAASRGLVDSEGAVSTSSRTEDTFRKHQFGSHKSEAARPSILRSSHKLPASEAHDDPRPPSHLFRLGWMAVPPFESQVCRPTVTLGRPGTGSCLASLSGTREFLP